MRKTNKVNIQGTEITILNENAGEYNFKIRKHRLQISWFTTLQCVFI